MWLTAGERGGWHLAGLLSFADSWQHWQGWLAGRQACRLAGAQMAAGRLSPEEVEANYPVLGPHY